MTRSERFPPQGEIAAACFDCGRPYGDENGFPDLIIPHASWRAISPSDDDAGLLCPSCLCARLDRSGIECVGAFTSGPIVLVPREGLKEHMFDQIKPQAEIDRGELDHAARAALFAVLALDALFAVALIGFVVWRMVG